jgi:sialidase-1
LACPARAEEADDKQFKMNFLRLNFGIWSFTDWEAELRLWCLMFGVSLLAGCSAFGAPTNASPSELTDVFNAGADGYSCFRIPAMITTRSGVILAMADGRITNCADIPNPLDLVLKRSTDNGKSWGPLQVVADYGHNTNDTDMYPAYGITNPVPRVSAGDAALLLDRTNGRIWTLYDNGAWVQKQSRHRAIKLELRYSDDEGKTWSGAIDIEAQNRGLRPPGTDFMAGPGNGIQLMHGPHAGRLIFATYIWNKPFFSTLIYSDDHGRTWHLGGKSAEGGGETQIAETDNGHLLVTIRSNTLIQKGVRFFNRSEDGGMTWSTPYFESKDQPSIPDPKCQASLFRVDDARGKNGCALFLSNVAHPSARTNLMLRTSFDLGQTWPTSQMIYAGGAAYSSLTHLTNGALGLLFEADKYGRICFTEVRF